MAGEEYCMKPLLERDDIRALEERPEGTSDVRHRQRVCSPALRPEDKGLGEREPAVVLTQVRGKAYWD